MSSGFRKISRVGNLSGGTRWYLSDGCLLAAKRTLYVVEYRRFYLRDLESIVVWPSRLWLWRMIIPGIALSALGASLWVWANSTAGEIFTGFALAWVVLELMLGPTANSRVRTTGVTVELPVVKRTRRADKVLTKISAAVRASRDVTVQPNVSTPNLQQTGRSFQTDSEAVSAPPSVVDTSQSNGF